MNKKEERGQNISIPPKKTSDNKPLTEGQTITPPPKSVPKKK